MRLFRQDAESVPSSPRARKVWVVVLGMAGAATVAAAGFAGYQIATWPDVAALAERPPESTAFIDAYRTRRRDAGESDRVAWTWVPMSRISGNLQRAAVAAEDIEFFQHDGFSRSEIRAAIREAIEERSTPRGASTITQQLAKNLWLSPSRNPWRKGKEVLLTKQLETHLTKRRILELYLNVAEFGRGIYGAEAASWHYFGKPASELTRTEAAMLAASLPRPSSWHPGADRRGYVAYVAEIERRMAVATFLDRFVDRVEPPVDTVPPPADSAPLSADSTAAGVANHVPER